MDKSAAPGRGRFICENFFMLHNQIRPGEAGEDWAEMYLDVVQESKNPYGLVHGGALFTMADCCAGRVARLDGRMYVTQDASVQFIRNVDSGRLTARGTVLSRGRRVCLIQVEIREPEGGLLFHGIFTMFCIREKAD